MKHSELSTLTLGLMLALGMTLGSATAGGGQSACERTAKVMYQACRSDISDDYKVTIANCINIEPRAERIECRAEAAEQRSEEAQVCADQFEARSDACDILGEERYDPDPLLDPGIAFVDPDEIDEASLNPYVSLRAGHTRVLRTGEEGKELVIIHVTDETREIQGVACRVVVDAVVSAEEDAEDGDLEYVPVEITDDWFAQDVHENVYYCGELARNFEDGTLVDLDGSFQAGNDFAKAGVLIERFPQAGDVHRQEYALGEAEDIVMYSNLMGVPEDENPRFPCAPNGGCLETYEFAPLEPESSEFKYYLPGVGFVLAVALEDGEPTGEREELICVGDSLEILEEEDCAIEDPDELLEELCELAPEAFCP